MRRLVEFEDHIDILEWWSHEAWSGAEQRWEQFCTLDDERTEEILDYISAALIGEILEEVEVNDFLWFDEFLDEMLYPEEEA